MTDLEVALAGAKAAGDIVRDGFGSGGRAHMKGHNNPVTETDQEAEAAIIAILSRDRPDDGVLGEEGSDRSGTRAGAGRRWIIDPLDGTVNFVHGFPHVAVSIGLYIDGEPALGVVLDPLRRETFVAVAGEGATLNGSPISVSPAGTLDGTLLATGFPYDRHERAAAYTRVVTRALESAGGIRRAGSAALDLAWVAAGRLDGYWEFGLAPWDLAAGILLVREAGGMATDPKGLPLTPWQPNSVVSNGTIHNEFLATLADVLPPHVREEMQ